MSNGNTRTTFVPWVRVTRVLPTLLVLNSDGALISYQSFFENGSALLNMYVEITYKNNRKMVVKSRKEEKKKTNAFFFPPFFPLEIRLFFLQNCQILANALTCNPSLNAYRRKCKEMRDYPTAIVGS